jgi:hypothetical protein
MRLFPSEGQFLASQHFSQKYRLGEVDTMPVKTSPSCTKYLAEGHSVGKIALYPTE